MSVVADSVEIGSIPVQVNSPVAPSHPWYCGIAADQGSFWASRFGTEVGDRQYAIWADFNEDGFVDLIDASIMARSYGEYCPTAKSRPGAAGSTVPVPAEPRQESGALPRIGIFFDPEGRSNCARVQPGEGVEFWVLAFQGNSALDGITGMEFSVHGAPSEWLLRRYFIAQPAIGLRGFAAAWNTCRRFENGFLELARGSFYATTAADDVVLSIGPALQLSNRFFECPLLTTCDLNRTCQTASSRPSRLCVEGLEATINPTNPENCSVAIARQAWGHIKQLYRERRPKLQLSSMASASMVISTRSPTTRPPRGSSAPQLTPKS